MRLLLLLLASAAAVARATFVPALNATAALASFNATKDAVATQLLLKKEVNVTVDPTATRFTGTVTCFVDDGSGDVVGLQFGTAKLLRVFLGF